MSAHTAARTTDRTRLVLAVAVLAAAGLTLTPLPVGLLCLPVLVGVLGHAAARLLVRETEIPAVVLATLFGLLGLGVVTLGLHVTGFGIQTAGVAIGTAGLALILLAVPGPTPSIVLPRPRHALGAAAALVVLGLATAGAVAIQPADDTPYTQLTLVAAPESVRAGASVDVQWTLSGDDVQVPDTVFLSDDEVAGTTRLTAPTTPGLWSTPVRVTSTSGAGTRTDELVLNLEVVP